jgi:hypothetical protein
MQPESFFPFLTIPSSFHLFPRDIFSSYILSIAIKMPESLRPHGSHERQGIIFSTLASNLSGRWSRDLQAYGAFRCA